MVMPFKYIGAVLAVIGWWYRETVDPEFGRDSFGREHFLNTVLKARRSVALK